MNSRAAIQHADERFDLARPRVGLARVLIRNSMAQRFRPVSVARNALAVRSASSARSLSSLKASVSGERRMKRCNPASPPRHRFTTAV
jgi:hypothetical protein